jgi:hypothetical protein
MFAMRLTKIDVAEAHLVTAARCQFSGEHPASVYLLASAAREILTTIGDKKGIRTMLAGLAEDTGRPMKEIVAAAHEFAGFLKHADRDPTAILDKLEHADVDTVLFIACHDFGRVTGGKPIELQVYEAWWFAQAFKKVGDAGLRVQPIVKRCIQLFPGIRRAPRPEKLRLGREQLEKARHDPRLKMVYEREVTLPEASAIQKR